MNRDIKEMLAAERCGRALALTQQPAAGDTWTVKAGHGFKACALMAAARWAARYGADVSIHLPVEEDPSPVWQTFAASSRLQELVVDGGRPGDNRLILHQDGCEWEVVDFPDPDEAWSVHLTVSWPMVKPVDQASLRLTTQQCRKVDAVASTRYGVPGICLMENASVAATSVAMDMLDKPAPVLVVAGGGNNGGDGLAMARGLDLLGCAVTVALLKPADTLRGDALANYQLLGEISTIRVRELAGMPDEVGQLCGDASFVIDALLGTGFTGDLSKPFRQAIECINQSGKPVLGIDIPSGLDSDSGGITAVAVRCERTITFAAVKPGLEKENGPGYAGRLYIADIGAPAEALDANQLLADI